MARKRLFLLIVVIVLDLLTGQDGSLMPDIERHGIVAVWFVLFGLAVRG